MTGTPDPPEAAAPEGELLPLARDRTFWGLTALGLVLLGWCLFLNRISLGGPMGFAPTWVHDLARPFDLFWSTLFGPLAADDWAVTGQRVRLGQFLSGTAVASLAYLVAAWMVLRSRRGLSPRAWELVLVVAIVARVLPVFSPPLLETDPYRYLWDGAALNAGVNPYRYAPEEVKVFATGRSPVLYTEAQVAELRTLVAAARTPAVGRALGLVNHPTLPTVYPPVAQALFGLSGWLAPGDIQVLKGLVALVDLGVLALVVWLLGLLGRRRELALLYAWCPLVLKEFPGAAHYDALASLFLLLALGLLLRHRRALAGVCLGLATMSKVYPALVALVLFRRLGRRGLLAAAATVGLLSTPLLFAGARSAEGFLVFGARWTKNASVFALVRSWFSGWDAAPANLQLPALGSWTPPPIPIDSLMLAKVVLVPLALLTILWVARRPEDEPHEVITKAYLAIATLLVFSPVGNPWYLGWILPLAALQGSLAWPLVSGGAIGYYAYHFEDSYRFAAPLVGALDVRWLEYLPGYGLFLAELRAGYPSASGVEIGASRAEK